MEKKDKFIVTDDHYRPMSFDGDQFCYVPARFNRVGRPSSFKIDRYTRKQAEMLIKASNDYRISRGWYIDEFYLIPVR